MEDLALKFFPYPHVLRGERRQGARIKWPERCNACDRQCEHADGRGLQLCSYGINYQRIDDDLLIAGVVVRDYQGDTEARRKMLRRLHTEAISHKEIDEVVALCGEANDAVEAELQARLDEVVAEYRRTKGYQRDIVKAIKPDLQKALAQVHDYKQFVQQILNNLDVVLESRFPHLPLEEKLNKASHAETAIYWAAVVMDEKLDAAMFLEAPDRIYEPREQKRMRLHGLVLKYVRIYQSRADRRGLTVNVVGESWGDIEGNARALGIIPHTLLDNAIKYAPEGSEIEVAFEENARNVKLVLTGLGPRIRDDEKDRIFDLSYRGSAARRRFKEGTGFGLASAQNIAKAHDTRIEVDQSSERDANGDHETSFSVQFRRAQAARKDSARGKKKRRSE